MPPYISFNGVYGLVDLCLDWLAKNIEIRDVRAHNYKNNHHTHHREMRMSFLLSSIKMRALLVLAIWSEKFDTDRFLWSGRLQDEYLLWKML